MKKSLVTMLLVLATAALVQQSAAQGAAQPAQAGQPAQPTQKKEIKDPAEYNAYVNAIQQTNPQAKAQGLEAFRANVSQQRDEGRCVGAADGGLPAGQRRARRRSTPRTGCCRSTPITSGRLALLAYNYRAAASQGGPQMQQNLQQAQQYGQKGLQALQHYAQTRRHERRRFHQAP